MSNSNINRVDVNEDWAHSGIVEAGGFAFMSYCVGNIGQPIEAQINGAFDHLEKRLELIGLNLEAVVKIDCLFRDIWDIPLLEKVLKERFNHKYPAENQSKLNLHIVVAKRDFYFSLTQLPLKVNKIVK